MNLCQRSVASPRKTFLQITAKVKKGAVTRTGSQVATRTDCKAKRVVTPVPMDQSNHDSEEGDIWDSSVEEKTQIMILRELQKITARLVKVKGQVAHWRKDQRDSSVDSKLSRHSKSSSFGPSVSKSKRSHKHMSDSSDDDLDLPSLSEIRASRRLQQKK